MRDAVTALGNILNNSHPSLAIDLDGCCDESPVFFKTLTSIWPGKVYVITFRSNRDKAISDLAKYEIQYDELILVQSFDAKAEVIVQEGISFYFDDQPEMLKNIPANVSVMLFRNEGNFDYNERKWMFSDQTGKQV